MTVSSSVKTLLRQRTKRYIKLAEDRFNREFNMPQIEIIPLEYGVGAALFIPWRIQLDEHLLRCDTEIILDNTLPHEIAHLIDLKLNLATYAKMKRIPWHAYAFKSIMKTFGATPLTYYVD